MNEIIIIEFTEEEINKLVQNYEYRYDESYSIHTANMIYDKLKELKIIEK